MQHTRDLVTVQYFSAEAGFTLRLGYEKPVDKYETFVKELFSQPQPSGP